MTAQVGTPEAGPVAASAAVVKHTYHCARCKATGRIYIRGHRLRALLAAQQAAPTDSRRIQGG
ncbi:MULTISPECIES: hypothetical protein [Streptomyces]|uniref:hypothetical protein n=1 Tax=Streptomyces TaxID=1883 RepID=UPI001E647FB0|nr:MULTISPECIES: hypothetical protein [Streptomyces]UFQ18242.1 hypothetical protein J2N69_26385 [Streptomyces huasconensis]WCL87855.1 hypothetical protein PPN52_26380 [Streptomyces sp. JCM 35825]